MPSTNAIKASLLLSQLDDAQQAASLLRVVCDLEPTADNRTRLRRAADHLHNLVLQCGDQRHRFTEAQLGPMVAAANDVARHSVRLLRR